MIGILFEYLLIQGDSKGFVFEFFRQIGQFPSLIVIQIGEIRFLLEFYQAFAIGDSNRAAFF